MEPTTVLPPPARPLKTTWEYCEKSDKNTVYHKISVTKDRFTHQSENKNAKTSRKERTDISIKNIHSVSVSYSHSRNVPLVILLAIAATLLLGGAVAAFFYDMLILCAALLGASVAACVVTFLVFRKIKNAFMLEINTYGTITSDLFSYGHADISSAQSAKKRTSPLFALAIFAVSIAFLIPSIVTNYNPNSAFMSFIYRNQSKFQIILIADAVLSMVGHLVQTLKANKKSAGAKYKFEMSPEVGYDIVETIGSLIMDKD